jgi:hypothetical protein
MRNLGGIIFFGCISTYAIELALESMDIGDG